MRPPAYSSDRELTPAPRVAAVRMDGPGLNPTSCNGSPPLLPATLNISPLLRGGWGRELTPTPTSPFLRKRSAPSAGLRTRCRPPISGPRLPSRTTLCCVLCEPRLVTQGWSMNGSWGAYGPGPKPLCGLSRHLLPSASASSPAGWGPKQGCGVPPIHTSSTGCQQGCLLPERSGPGDLPHQLRGISPSPAPPAPSPAPAALPSARAPSVAPTIHSRSAQLLSPAGRPVPVCPLRHLPLLPWHMVGTQHRLAEHTRIAPGASRAWSRTGHCPSSGNAPAPTTGRQWSRSDLPFYRGGNRGTEQRGHTPAGTSQDSRAGL